jgi:hypothetical protein
MAVGALQRLLPNEVNETNQLGEISGMRVTLEGL